MDFTPPPPPLRKSGLNWFVMKTLYTEASSLRALKIMPRNLNEIVRSFHEFGFRSQVVLVEQAMICMVWPVIGLV
jgi:hypothetical protein